ncbi:MAG: LysR family transcriptional regulator [Paucibacter sp.]|nr:LysR family transcriptional regulator [Roseateles sp.]
MGLEADDLLLYARVVDAGSLSRAAEQLRLPKSTVSRRLSGLEQRLGEKLLQRSTRRLTLTDFGQGVLEHARAVAAEVDGALALALHRQQRPRGRLRVSMPSDLARLVLAGAIARFVQDYPEVHLELDLSPRRVDLIAEGFDLALRIGALNTDSQLAARRLTRLSTSLYASPAHLAANGEPQLPEGLTSMHALMIRSRGGEPIPWELVRGDQSVTVLPDSRTLANAPDMLLLLAKAGVGIAPVEHQMAEPLVASGELVPVLPDWQLRIIDCWAVFPERKLMPLKTRAFIEAMGAVLKTCSSGD